MRNTFKMFRIDVLIVTLIAIQLPSILCETTSTKPMIKKSIVRNVTDCDGQGELLQVTLPGCSNSPCDLKIGQTYNLGAYFRTKQEHQGFEASLVVSTAKTNTSIFKVDQSVDVEQGMICTFAYPLSVTSALGLGPATLRMTVSENRVHELCALVEGNIHE